MNKVELVGRLTKDVDVYQAGDSTTAKITVACDRKFKNKEGQYDADFISCVAFGRTADFLKSHFSKGMRIGLTGRIQTGSYTNRDGQKVYTTDVVIDDVEFVENKSSAMQYQAPPQQVVPQVQPQVQPQQMYQQMRVQPQQVLYQQMPQQAMTQQTVQQTPDFMQIPAGVAEELPFR